MSLEKPDKYISNSKIVLEKRSQDYSNILHFGSSGQIYNYNINHHHGRFNIRIY